MAVINTGLLTKGLKSEFFNRFEGTKTHFQDLATRIPSTSDSETYRWLGTVPQIREWGADSRQRALREPPHDRGGPGERRSRFSAQAVSFALGLVRDHLVGLGLISHPKLAKTFKELLWGSNFGAHPEQNLTSDPLHALVRPLVLFGESADFISVSAHFSFLPRIPAK
ncbi:MAG: Mu-like prophage major head subunit gpT family protein [Planctomycetes bacterium]|nr:Mu-like prophage major head subunit gpT family protein [Planctomycetota bacterium]